MMKEDARRPLLGILTVRDDDAGFRGNKSYYQRLSEFAATLGERIVVIPTDFALHLHRERTSAWQWRHKSGTWQAVKCPLPSVLYNRIPTREAESSPQVTHALRMLRREGSIPIFNPHYFNKWQLYAWLKHRTIPNVYLPDTRRLLAAEDGIHMHKMHPELYVKPVSGKAGIDFYRVDRDRIRKQNGSGVSTTTVSSGMNDLWNQLWPDLQHGHYIVQQAVPLAKYHGLPFDLRVLNQKNRAGKWTVSGIGVRVAGATALTTHVPRGGSIAQPEAVLQQAFPNQSSESLLKMIRQASIHTAGHIASAAGQLWGEMSMDWGLDEHGRLWFFEANAKPMIFDEPDIFQRSLRRIVEFSRHLRQRHGRI